MTKRTRSTTVLTTMNKYREEISRQTRIDVILVRIIVDKNMGTKLGPVRIYDAYMSNRNDSNTMHY